VGGGLLISPTDHQRDSLVPQTELWQMNQQIYEQIKGSVSSKNLTDDANEPTKKIYYNISVVN
jgi:hypothetical protein